MSAQSQPVTATADTFTTFTDEGEFIAFRKATEWLAAQGYSVGRMQRDAPIGIMRGDCDIQKWRNLSSRDIAELDGAITGNFRDGPVRVRVRAAAISEAAGEAQ